MIEVLEENRDLNMIEGDLDLKGMDMMLLEEVVDMEERARDMMQETDLEVEEDREEVEIECLLLA
jgi:hypothetical protein